MILIVVGHVVGSPGALFNSVSAPIYSKQLGVAFFVFVAGWGLANCHRPRLEEAFKRLFPMLFYGGVCALLMSAVAWIDHRDLAESNYLPLAFGGNVFLNYFPSNPTTWYIGMYLHLILLWWWLVPKHVSLLWIPIVIISEILIRAFFLDIDRAFTGYMLVSNWATVFLLGYLLRMLGDSRRNIGEQVLQGSAAILAWLSMLALWQSSELPIAFDGGFPTRRLGDLASSMLLVSALVSVIYVANTLLAFAVFRCFRTPWIIRFIARNTLLIFILHMPLIYAFSDAIYAFFEAAWQQKLAMIIVIFVSLGVLSELVNRLIPLKQLSNWFQQRLHIGESTAATR